MTRETKDAEGTSGLSPRHAQLSNGGRNGGAREVVRESGAPCDPREGAARGAQEGAGEANIWGSDHMPELYHVLQSCVALEVICQAGAGDSAGLQWSAGKRVRSAGGKMGVQGAGKIIPQHLWAERAAAHAALGCRLRPGAPWAESRGSGNTHASESTRGNPPGVKTAEKNRGVCRWGLEAPDLAKVPWKHPHDPLSCPLAFFSPFLSIFFLFLPAKR